MTPKLLERMGRVGKGSITGLLTVLVDGEGEDDPPNCDGAPSQADCDKDFPACVWCFGNGALKSTCLSKKQAAALPPGLFQCKRPAQHLEVVKWLMGKGPADPNCNGVPSQSDCDKTSGCKWWRVKNVGRRP